MKRYEYARELIGTICACGAPKGKGKAFCLRCYRSLPQALQARLYCHIGEGYEQAFAEALAYLAPAMIAQSANAAQPQPTPAAAEERQPQKKSKRLR